MTTSMSKVGAWAKIEAFLVQRGCATVYQLAEATGLTAARIRKELEYHRAVHVGKATRTGAEYDYNEDGSTMYRGATLWALRGELEDPEGNPIVSDVWGRWEGYRASGPGGVRFAKKPRLVSNEAGAGRDDELGGQGVPAEDPKG